MAGKSYKYVPSETTILDAIATFYSQIEELGQEAREIVDSSSENLAQSPRIITFGETADTLENISEADSPLDDDDDDVKVVSVLTVTVLIAQPKSRRQATSRAVRCENACGYGRTGIDAIREWCDDQENDLSAEDFKAKEDFVQALRDYADEVEAHIDEAESVEFPGMYG